MLPPSTPAQFQFVETFQAMMKKVVATLPTATQPDSGIFSPACFHHVSYSFYIVLVEPPTFGSSTFTRLQWIVPLASWNACVCCS